MIFALYCRPVSAKSDLMATQKQRFSKCQTFISFERWKRFVYINLNGSMVFSVRNQSSRYKMNVDDDDNTPPNDNERSQRFDNQHGYTVNAHFPVNASLTEIN